MNVDFLDCGLEWRLQVWFFFALNLGKLNTQGLAFVPTLIASVIGVPNRKKKKKGAAIMDLKLGLLY